MGIQQARMRDVYPVHDQQMLNIYRKNGNERKHTLLPIYYNWKVYWKLEPSSFSQIKIVHFHGPKPGRGLEGMAKCNLTAVSAKVIGRADYGPFLHQGICCD